LQNDSLAQRELGLAFECEKGVPKNLQEAARLYSLAAGNGDMLARSLLKGLDPSSNAKMITRPNEVCANWPYQY
jgi:TPR repeat protein